MNSQIVPNTNDLSYIASVWLVPTLIKVIMFMFSSLSYAATIDTKIDTTTGINQALPIHQKAKTHVELADPVLGDQLEIVEWAWSPQYAKRFSLSPQANGLKDGPLWLIGVKIQRIQTHHKFQRYTCHVVGLMDSKLPIITPPGDRFFYAQVINNVPGKLAQNELTAYAIEQRNYAPGFMTWHKKPLNKRQETHPKSVDGMGRYVAYIRNFSEGLSYFEADIGCAYFDDPSMFRNEIRFPTRIDGKNDHDPKVGAVFEDTAVNFDLPDGMMHRIYPYTVDADDWTSCLMSRSGRVGRLLTLHAIKLKRFDNRCEPVNSIR